LKAYKFVWSKFVIIKLSILITKLKQKGWFFVPTIFFYGPELEKDKKRELIESFTESASKATGIDKSAFVVYLRSSSPENVGVGGKLLTDIQQK